MAPIKKQEYNFVVKSKIQNIKLKWKCVLEGALLRGIHSELKCLYCSNLQKGLIENERVPAVEFYTH